MRIWGVLAEGKLHISILPPGETWHAEVFSTLVDDCFEDWMGTCTKLIADYEGFLRSQEALEAYDRIGVSLVDDYPPVSQDFNAIENCWKLLCDRLNGTILLRWRLHVCFGRAIGGETQFAKHS